MKESKIRISGISEAMETVSRKPMQIACGKREKRKTYIKRQALAGIFRLVPVNSDQGFAIWNSAVFQLMTMNCMPGPA